jgi:hypothetical protein
VGGPVALCTDHVIDNTRFATSLDVQTSIGMDVDVKSSVRDARAVHRYVILMLILEHVDLCIKVLL